MSSHPFITQTLYSTLHHHNIQINSWHSLLPYSTGSAFILKWSDCSYPKWWICLPLFHFLLHQLNQESTGYLSEQSCWGHVTPYTITQTKMESKRTKRSDCLLHIIHRIEWGYSIKTHNTLEFQARVILTHEWKDDSCCLYLLQLAENIHNLKYQSLKIQTANCC